MTKNDSVAVPAADDERDARRRRSERLTRIMWAYICAAITLLSFAVGLGPSLIPLGFGILGCVLATQLMRENERQHSVIAGALALGGIMIWLTANWPTIHRYIGG